MMQMLAAGGLPVLTDQERKPDIDNPRGYCEWEPVKLLPKQPDRIDEAEGRAVKIISELLLSLPRDRDEMLKRRGSTELVDHALLRQAFREHMQQIVSWLELRNEIPLCRMGFRKLLRDPTGSAQTICDFLELNLNVEAMARAVDISLYRNRCS